jgi:hypothetical protein
LHVQINIEVERDHRMLIKPKMIIILLKIGFVCSSYA